MKPSLPLLFSFLLPLSVAANAHAEEPSGATPRSMTPVAAPAPLQPTPILGLAAPTGDTALAPASPRLERRSEALRTAGIVLIPVGAVAMVGGSMVAVFSGMGDTFENSAENDARRQRTAISGVAAMGLGALALTGGIIMTVIGSKKVPAHSTEALAPAPRVAVEPLIGMGTGGVKVTF